MTASKPKYLAYKCARCFTEKASKLAWFYQKDSMWDNTFLCRLCFKEAFNKLTQEQKKEYWWYDNKK